MWFLFVGVQTETLSKLATAGSFCMGSAHGLIFSFCLSTAAGARKLHRLGGAHC